MILAVDIGNTNIVVGLLEGTTILNSGRIATDRKKTNMDFIIQLKLMLSVFKVKEENIDGSILSSVVPELTNQLFQALKDLLNKKPFVVGPGLKTGLNIKIDNPQTLGADRVCDAVCIIEEYKVPAIIIDMGTATTISVIDKNKNHIGGMIIPGIKTSLDSLSTNASQLPYISLEKPKTLIGKNTIDCMKSGIIYGNVSLIDGLIDKIKEEMNEDFVLIATGGLSRLIIPYSKHKIIYDENLLLKGLYYIYKKNA
ncbi:MAG: type III pantothenate kinase [Acholeplasmatales bacterium]|nr:type III pantothenate kinase [Acholeplasmatales bacterium]